MVLDDFKNNSDTFENLRYQKIHCIDALYKT